ncbi:MAG TPA: tetratricopeptide repeat protein [Rhizomicrobium sp.]|jgi:TPR repeat protein|nr:tetratricopeptide repeat protein [Rhizomicrobium sp.]
MRPSVPLLCACLSVSACTTAESHQQLSDIFRSGVTAYDAGQYAQAYKIWTSIEDQDIAAMRNVAMMLRKGQGVAKNPKKAEEFYMQAAELGLPTAQADLADMLLKGEAGPPNPKAALPLLQAAAAANHPLAQYELGEMYESGELVPKDLDIARSLYAKAARHGVTEAGGRLAALGPPAGVQPAKP